MGGRGAGGGLVVILIPMSWRGSVTSRVTAKTLGCFICARVGGYDLLQRAFITRETL